MRSKIFFSIVFIFIANLAFGQLEGIKICIDPGHGGHDPSNDRKIPLPHGLVFWESEGNLMTGLHERDLLLSLGANVKMTRTENDDSDDIALSSRVAIANAFGADYFQSNHTNAGSAGTNYSLVLFRGKDNSPQWSDAKAMGAIIAPNLQDLLRTTRNYNRGDQSFLGFSLGVLRNTNMPATLSEGSFHDIPEEALRLKNSEYSKNYAWALVKSFCKYFKVDGFPTGRIGGIVKNQQSGEVINNVQVTVQPGNKTYTGDDFYNGFYGFDLDTGTYTLTFSRTGFFDVEKTVTIKANTYINLDLTLPLNLNGFPYVDFDILGLPAGALDTVTFDASNSYDDGQIVKYEWFLNDSIVLDTGKIIKYAFGADGQYNITLKLTDNEDKSSSLTKSVEIKTEPPKIPVLLSVESTNNNKGVIIKWKKNLQSGLAGYRIYYNINPFLENLNILADTNILKPNVTQLKIDSLGQDSMYVFWIQSVNKAGIASDDSDMYGIYHFPKDTTSKKLLIVDGFHRRSSYIHPSHTFASTCYLMGLKDADIPVDVNTVMNENIITGKTVLSDYDIVIWFLGDESTVDQTFSAAEQNKVKDYLNQGGRLFVTGSEIGWDLDKKGSSTDRKFYHDYLKASFVADGSTGRSPAQGISGNAFEGVTLHYGVVYVEDYPDAIAPYGESSSILKYNQGSVAGIAYKGIFGSSSTTGAVVNIGFPLETISNRKEIKFFMQKLFNYFNFTTAVKELPQNASKDYKIYPTVFHNSIYVMPDIENNSSVNINIYDINAKPVYSTNIRLLKGEKKEIILNTLPAGIYILNISDGVYIWNYKIIKE